MLEITGERKRAHALNQETVTLETLYERHAAQVLRHAYFLLGSRDDAEDITQETFLRAHRALNSFAARSHPLTWLLRITTNLCYDHRRQQLRQQKGEATLPALESTPDISTQVTQTETTRQLLRVLDGLPLSDRTVLVLHLLEDLNYVQIAQVLNCNRYAAKMRTLRALRRFRERAERFFLEKEERS
ncbi:MAG: RNA polymerase sigma factor [Armatimonas sp.]